MSNLLNSTALQRIYDDVPNFGYAMAMKSDGMVDVGDRLFRACLSDTDLTCEIVAPLYDAIRAEAVKVGAAKRKPLKEQKRKSRDVQINKMENFIHLAGFAQDNDNVEKAYSYLRDIPSEDKPDASLGISGYTKVIGALVAMQTVLVKDSQADEPTLRNAIVASLASEPTLASEAVTKVASDWEKLVMGNAKTGEHPYQAQFAKLAERNPEVASNLLASLTGIAAIFEGWEKEASRLALAAKGGLSV